MDKLIGTEIEGYIVEKMLDDGGTGVVYLAKKPRSDKYVTIKIISEDKIGDADVLQRYMREMRLLEEISHPNVKPMINWGITADERPYLISEFIAGSTLHQYMQATPPSPLAAWAILEPLTEVLDFLHKQDIIHRNFKPKKILIEAETGKVFLNDFGSSKQQGVDATLANSVMSIAPVVSPEYMAPEMAHADTQEVDYRADLYSLALVAYEMLLGRLPFPPKGKGAYMQLAIAHLQTPPPLPCNLNPTFPESLQAVLLKGLEKDPNDRYQSAKDFGADYHAALVGLSEAEQNTVYWV